MLSDTQLTITEEQHARLESGAMVSVRASWEEFLEFLAETPYRVDYHNQHIMIMGLASFLHELLVGQLITLLTNLFDGKNLYVAGSNVGVLKAAGKGYYNPDITVVSGMPVFHKGSDAILTNPHLVVEVLSESTAGYDLYHKLPKLQQIDSLTEVIVVDRFDQLVTVFRRTDKLNVWIETQYDKPDDEVQIAGQYSVKLVSFFANLPILD